MEQISSLHEEIWEQIFVKSCVKSVERLSCVRKAWCDLIKTPYFCKKYNSNHNQHVLLRMIDLNDHDDPHHVLLSFNSQSVFVNLPFDVYYGAVQSCNGILFYNYGFETDHCILYHPFTQEHQTLPRSSLYKVNIVAEKGTIARIKAFDFGFDSSNNDYKVVRVWIGKGQGAEIYRLSTNSWSKLSIEDDRRSFYASGMFLNSVNHWRRLRHDSDCVQNLLTFNFKDEKFGYMECPRGCRKGLLGVLDESLAICSYKYGDQMNSNTLEGIEIWIMREYGKMESWNKVYCINELAGFGLQSIVTLWIHDMKLVLLENHGKVVVCEMDKARVMFALDGNVTRGVVVRPTLPSLQSRRFGHAPLV